MHQFADLLIWYFVFVFSTTCHEAAHALVAYRGGDPTAYAGGHVTLDPLPHIRRSPMGMVVIPIVTFLLNGSMIGWASVPTDPTWTRSHPRRAALMALAGPFANMSLALLAFGAMRLLLTAHIVSVPYNPSFAELVVVPDGANLHSPLGALARALSITLSLNVLLGLFNLIPVPPLDGAVVLQGSKLGTRLYDRMREVPAIELLGLLAAWRLCGYVTMPALSWAVRALYS
jgi:Zn-dependent protease